MVGKDLLFRWEDSPALRHHCGFCDRPLSHPGAKTSCFGPHSEPCCRFHQAMFMRNKSHTCAMCNTADDAHSKRHNEIADRLRAIYDLCGEEEWPIVPADAEPERGRGRTREDDALGHDDDRSSASTGGWNMSKKERKELKRLERAASRPRFVTLEDRIHIGLVLHATDRRDNTDGPDTTEQVAEIEKHLRYNAQVYHEGEKRGTLRDFGNMSDVSDADVDFQGEMMRIQDTFRITELQKRNTKNKGLTGKTLREFNTLVGEFKALVVDDLLLLKKEELEIRMRRAAYLRYTNRTSFEIVRDRYEDKDWRTGEKHSAPTSENSRTSSSLPTLNEHDGEDEQVNGRETPPTPIGLTEPGSPRADNRHINRDYKRIGDNGHLETVVESPRIETSTPYKRHASGQEMAPASPSPWKSTPTVTPRPLPVLSIKIPNLAETASTTQGTGPLPALKGENVWQLFSKRNGTSSPTVKPAWQQKTSLPDPSVWPKLGLTPEPAPWDTGPSDVTQMAPNLSPAHKVGSEKRIKPTTIKPVLAEPPPKQSSRVPPTPVESTPPHTVASEQAGESKKAKKRRREAERKLRRAAEEQAASSVTTTDDQPRTPDLDADQGFPSPEMSRTYILEDMPASDDSSQYDHELASPTLRDTTDLSSHNVKVASSSSSPSLSATTLSLGVKQYPLNATVEHLKQVKAAAIHIKSRPQPGSFPTSGAAAAIKPRSSQPLGPPVTKNGRHSDWLQFRENSKVDSLTDPVHKVHGRFDGPCPFEDSSTSDCQFHNHAPYCSCHDPLAEVCHIVYPSDDHHCSIGPFNRARARKLLCYFESQEQTKGKLMMIDASIKDWLIVDGCRRTIETPLNTSVTIADIPDRFVYPDPVKREVDEYTLGYPKGRLMLQTDDYRALRGRNLQKEHPLTEAQLVKLQRVRESDSGTPICYCGDSMPREHWTDIITCNHADCSIKYFHKKCVSHFGIDKVTRWYCSQCDLFISQDASKLLDELKCMRDGEPLPDWEDRNEELMEKFRDIGRKIADFHQHVTRQQASSVGDVA
ncbi:hypothetical protein CC80DRAFT_505134 [Byssothecium circinans]|uniref:Zinc finger PHD-type domain-containing protein n=1 Tax=Byssothecium circinans TaxID=147558 RepID=A0A6A5TT40_9PLEO|nr:hypothetical protein CC80DRAFT_505134 [Byssothecium circinans]